MATKVVRCISMCVQQLPDALEMTYLDDFLHICLSESSQTSVESTRDLCATIVPLVNHAELM